MGNQDASELMTIRVMALNVSSNGMILMRRGLSGFDGGQSREGSDWHGKEGKGGPAPRSGFSVANRKQAHIIIFTRTSTLLLRHAEYANPAIPGLHKQKWNDFGELFSRAREISPV